PIFKTNDLPIFRNDLGVPVHDLTGWVHQSIGFGGF
ncbi:MAG: hypothetical protein ACI957_004678, partial [Verrucomicrobiales bacterium]